MCILEAEITIKYLILFIVSYLHIINADDSVSNPALNAAKYAEALNIAQSTTLSFIDLFENCVKTSMPNQQFISDNLQKFINFPAKTTVGFAPKFTSNRKFFANMITTTSFKDMLARDEEEFRKNTIRKMKFCDSAVMDQDLLKDFYDREVDQSKI